ncbi:MAG: 50S ribosomal protein L30e [Euryarchaeota archaeon]|nr:50S ribosomal protein L30e [Euryarchaeota archaeon]|tara:strand:- start:29266 stop:29565 length:300 start_codon:yes stop_codon:yes gene_type:complete
MDLSRQLKNAIATGNLRFGQRQAVDACARGEAKLIIVAANCPVEYTDELHAQHPEVTMFRASMVNRELGIACGKPFSVSTISIIDAGDSDLLQLDSNIE